MSVVYIITSGRDDEYDRADFTTPIPRTGYYAKIPRSEIRTVSLMPDREIRVTQVGIEDSIEITCQNEAHQLDVYEDLVAEIPDQDVTWVWRDGDEPKRYPGMRPSDEMVKYVMAPTREGEGEA